jgi:Bacteriophage minor capsid protein
MSSLGDELCIYMQSQGVGNFNGGGTINLYSSLLPDQPDLAAAVIERGGLPPLRTLTGGPLPESKFDQPTVMIRVRSGMNGYSDGNSLAQLIYGTLQGLYEQVLNPPSGMFFHLISALQYPTYLGRDERERHLWSQNFRVWIENSQR